jgi:hypothetical protein
VVIASSCAELVASHLVAFHGQDQVPNRSPGTPRDQLTARYWNRP